MYPPKPKPIHPGTEPFEEVIKDPRWVAEAKLDGYRGIYRQGRLVTRQGKKMPGDIRRILTALAGMPDGTILDGEVTDIHGSPKFHVFDIPSAGGLLADRRKAIDSLHFNCHPVFVMHRIVKVEALLTAKLMGWEGVVFKRLDSTYRWQRSPVYCDITEWRKVRL